jgi:hypothetical protein
MLIFSWSWLVVGVFVITMMAVILPSTLNNLPARPGSLAAPSTPLVMDGVLAFMFVFYGFIFVLLPAIWTFFFNSRHVKATCEARHPLPDWTDACPLPVLGVVLWLAYSVVSTLALPLSGMGALPFFGTFLTGMTAEVGFIALGAVYLVAAWRIYRLDLRGWWLLVGVFGFFLISGTVTFAQHDLLDMYRAMHFPPDQLAQLEKSGVVQSGTVLGLTGLFCVPVFGYLIYIRRFFRPQVAA